MTARAVFWPFLGEAGPSGRVADSTRRAVEMVFSPLPGTAEEAQAIASVLPGATLLTGALFATAVELLGQFGPGLHQR